MKLYFRPTQHTHQQAAVAAARSRDRDFIPLSVAHLVPLPRKPVPKAASTAPAKPSAKTRPSSTELVRRVLKSSKPTEPVKIDADLMRAIAASLKRQAPTQADPSPSPEHEFALRFAAADAARQGQAFDPETVRLQHVPDQAQRLIGSEEIIAAGRRAGIIP